MSKALLLVTGATGATGRSTIASLLESGATVRAMIHRRDDRSEQLARRGVEVVLGDFADPNSIKSALHGVSAAYFCYPIDHGIVDASAFFAYAAKLAGVKVVANMSQIIAREDAKSHASFNHWLAERVFDWSGVPVVHLRPGFFMEWLLSFAPMIQQGTIYAPFDQGQSAFISAEDQGRVIAEILQNPKAHIGKTYRLFGPKEYTFAQATQAVGAVLGRKLVYQKVPYEAMVEGLISRSKGTPRNDALSGYAESHAKKGNGGDAPVVQHLREALEDHNNGLFAGMGDEVERITGKAPMGIEAFVRKHMSVFVPLAIKN